MTCSSVLRLPDGRQVRCMKPAGHSRSDNHKGRVGDRVVWWLWFQ